MRLKINATVKRTAASFEELQDRLKDIQRRQYKEYYHWSLKQKGGKIFCNGTGMFGHPAKLVNATASVRTAAEQDVDSQVEVLLKKFKFDGNKGPHSNDCRDFLDSILDLGFKKSEGKEGEKKVAQWTSPQSHYEFTVYIDHPTPKSATGELLDRVYAYRKQ